MDQKLQKYLDKADVFLFPSYTEGFSISLTEAMASGLPCIASDVGANQDMLENHGGILIKTKKIRISWCSECIIAISKRIGFRFL